MSHLHFATKHLNEAQVKRAWHIVDASDKPVGRLASKVAAIIMGKNKAYFSNHVDCGDYVIIVNAEKIKFTGNKMRDKKYIRYSNYPGGQKEITAIKLVEKNPTFIMQNSVKGMLPKNRLGRKMIKKLFVYTGTDHPHQAQKPTALSL